MSLEIRIAEKKDEKIWDMVVDESPHGTIFHKWKFLKIMEKYSKAHQLGKMTKAKLYPLIGFKGEEAIAIFPIYLYRTPLRMVYSPPIGTGVTHLGLVISKYDEMKQNKKENVLATFIKEANKFISTELKPRTINIKTSLNDPRHFLWLGYRVEPLYDYLLDLREGKEHIYKNLDADVRKNIQRAKRFGFVFSEGTNKDLKFVWRSVVKRHEEQNIKLGIQLNFLIDIYKAFGDNLKVFVAKEKGKPVTGMIIICYKGKTSLWVGSTKIKNVHYSANDFLTWEIIKWSCKSGYEYCENIWANDMRLCKFKSRFNPDISIYYSLKKSSLLYDFFKNLKRKTKRKKIGRNGNVY